MLRIFWNSKSAMIADQNKLDAISNNLANSETSGYKSEKVNFQDLVSESLKKVGYPTSAAGNTSKQQFTGSGVKSTGWIRDNTQGPLVATQQSTDLAIDGTGYFQVTRNDGSTAYTRDGSFSIDAENNLVDANGSKVNIIYNAGVDPNSVKFTPDNFKVSQSGEVMISGQNGYQDVGRIPTYTADGANAFRSDGDSYYLANPSTNVYEVKDPSINQGFVEGSNVDMVNEMTDMMITQRAFELNSNSLKTADQLWSMANNLSSK